MINQNIVLAGAENFAAAEILAHLADNNVEVTSAPTLDRDAVAQAFTRCSHPTALVVVTPQPVLGTAFLDVDDDALEASMQRTIDLITTVGVGLEALPDNGAIVVVGNRGYLGGWGGAHEMAASGAMMGFVRSTALAAMSRSIRANAIALDLPSRTPVDPSAAAALTLFLASPQSAFINGETILANRGRNLLLREASRRA